MKNGNYDVFNSVPVAKLGRTTFDLCHSHVTSFNMGELIPVACIETIPGDSMSLGTENLIKAFPMVAPIMSEVDVTFHWYFTPCRLVWSQFTDWITGEVEVTPPVMNNLQNISEGEIGDYMGIPMNVTNAALTASAMPFSALSLIFDEYYRDQNLVTEKFVPCVAGFNTSIRQQIAEASPFKRAWQHDYFTSCLPFAQKGDEVTLPLLQNTEAVVTYKTGLTTAGRIRKSSDDSIETTAANVTVNTSGDTQTNSTDSYYDPNGTLVTLINDDAVTVRTFRTAIALQRYLETNAMIGTRYTEWLWGRFGVKSSDARLQRPEYIGGTKGHLTISEVLSTAQTYDATEADIPVGSFAGHGIAVGGSNGLQYYAEEHGYIICLMNVQPKTSYDEGLHKMWSRDDRHDYFTPEFEHIGEQEVKLKELWAETFSDLETTFGYIPRYSDYKYLNNKVTAKLRGDLAYFTLTRRFSTKPALNEEFIEANVSDRIFVDRTQGTHQLIGYINIKCYASRHMKRFAKPKL